MAWLLLIAPVVFSYLRINAAYLSTFMLMVLLILAFAAWLRLKCPRHVPAMSIYQMKSSKQRMNILLMTLYFLLYF